MRRFFLGAGIVLVACFGALYATGGAGGDVGGRVVRGARYGGRAWPNPRASAYVDPDRNFLFATQSGIGMGTECDCADDTTVKGNAITFTRSTVAWCTKRDFSLVECPINKPRDMFDKGTPSFLGLIVSGKAGQNDVADNRDLSQSTWTKSSMTCAHTANGADLAANSASTCTATGSNGTVLQVVTAAGARRNTSLYIKRRTGVGAVYVSRDNGSTYTEITTGLSSSIFKRVASMCPIGAQFGGCIGGFDALTSTAANPTIVIKIAVSGNAVDIDLVQDELEFGPSSPITVVGAGPGMRGAENAKATGLPAFTAKATSWESSRTFFTGLSSPFDLSIIKDSETGSEIVPYTTWAFLTTPGLGGLNCYWSAGPATVNTPFIPVYGPVPQTCASNGTLASGATNGGTASPTISGAPIAGINTVWIGGRPPGSGGGAEVLFSNICADSVECPVGSNRATGSIAWFGDSITCGSAGAAPGGGDIEDGVAPPSELQKLVDKTVWNHAYPGVDVVYGQALWLSQIKPRSYTTLLYSAGTNNTIGGGGATAGHDAFAVTTTTINDALASGLNVVLGNIMPYGGAAGYTPSSAAGVAAYNADWATYCAAHSSNTHLACVNTYSEFGGQGGDPDVMQEIWGAADKRHINAAGARKLAAIFYVGLVAVGGT